MLSNNCYKGNLLSGYFSTINGVIELIFFFTRKLLSVLFSIRFLESCYRKKCYRTTFLQEFCYRTNFLQEKLLSNTFSISFLQQNVFLYRISCYRICYKICLLFAKKKIYWKTLFFNLFLIKIGIDQFFFSPKIVDWLIFL